MPVLSQKMSWFKKSQTAEENLRRDQEYFDIGHGDFSEEHGFEPDYIVWAWLDGQVKTSNVGKIDREGREEGGGTHGWLWGHEKCDRTYKGRYEPQTGRLSIVKPCRGEFRPIPEFLIIELHSAFPNITKVYEF